ncbi:uncharacterized protein LOC133836724 [Drosophila sulfurigaster albostrigata]|uniref:uncharacterized protein LOC133836724 n=1 Tax=Drosophila sulfurigaster albostrigata TaxID=89887 RepID=UPI002D21EA69|nr:uncharacterized protein LOC133836724 [Drosophila sulfurigaster albostrigata]
MFSLFRRLVGRSRKEETAIAICNNANPIDEDVDSTLRRIASPDAFTNFLNEFRLEFLRSKGRDRLTLQESSKLRKAASVEWSRLSDRRKRKYKQLATDWRNTRVSVTIMARPEAAESTNTSQSLTLVHVDNLTIAEPGPNRIRSNLDVGERASTSRASRLAGLQIGQGKHRIAPKVMGLRSNRANMLQARNSIRRNGRLQGAQAILKAGRVSGRGNGRARGTGRLRGTARVQRPTKLQRTPQTSKRTFAIRSEQFIPRALGAAAMRRSPALPSIEDFASNAARVRSRAPKRARLVQPVDPRLHDHTSSTELAQSIVPRKMKKLRQRSQELHENQRVLIRRQLGCLRTLLELLQKSQRLHNHYPCQKSQELNGSLRKLEF